MTMTSTAPVTARPVSVTDQSTGSEGSDGSDFLKALTVATRPEATTTAPILEHMPATDRPTAARSRRGQHGSAPAREQDARPVRGTAGKAHPKPSDDTTDPASLPASGSVPTGVPDLA
ncbi:MAG TPA: hypothetical protein VHN80_07115, partial [Kineosporiaceae bacterium]|nr:hypothetical protein [Kineosporiaceae bacterium]